MEIEYSLDEKDYLEYLLYEGSKNKFNIEKRKQSRSIIFFIILAVVMFPLLSGDFLVAIFYSFIALFFLVFYPKYQSWVYKKYYIRTTNESYKNNFGELTRLILNENNIEALSPYTELKIKNEAFVAINEIENYIFLKTNYGGTIVIPKLKISNLEDFKKYLKLMMQKYDIKENIELDWKWK